MIHQSLRCPGLVVSLLFLSGVAQAGGKVSLDTSLRIAAREGRLQEVKALLDQGADVNATGSFGETALMGAARFNHKKVAELLLERGANVNLSDAKETTALMFAGMNCSHRFSDKMIAADANVNLTNDQGRTALIYATMSGCKQMVKQLLQATGIDLNVVDESGRTALDHAMTEAQIEVGGPYTDIAFALRSAGAKTVEYELIPRQTHPEVIAPGKLK